MPGVRRFEVVSRQPVFSGTTFGDGGAVGEYELVSGKAYCEIDPFSALNRGIVNLEKAPVNGRGFVEYAVDVHIYKPREIERGNGWLFYEYLNRGTQRGIVRINNAPYVALPTKAEDIGNGFLMHQGFTIVYSAWQGNVEPGGGRMLADFPIARDAGKPIVGQAVEEFILDATDSIRGAQLQELDADRMILTLSYPCANVGADSSTLTVRQHEFDDRADASTAGFRWRYLDDYRVEVERLPEATVDRGALFEFVYEARDPVVMGLAYASVRDLVSFLKYPSRDDGGSLNPLFDTHAAQHAAAGDADAVSSKSTALRALGFGLSQSGRVLRDFLYEGFNESLAGRPVFDAAVPIIAGSRRAWVNAPFSQPGRYSRQHEDHTYPGDQFPFAYQTVRDPISGRTDGILARARASGTCPKVMHLDTDSEVWSARASLVATDCEGRDLPEDPDVRLYLASSVAHGDYPLPSQPVTVYQTNPLTYGATLRALFVAMVQWVDDGKAPPPSCFPSHATGTWWTVEAFREAFEACRGVASPRYNNVLRLLDHTTVPPRVGPAYPSFVPAVDANGNGRGGVRHPLVEAPTGTHTGWALRAPGYAEGSLYSVYGSFIPFSSDKQSPWEARYASLDAWQDAVNAAAVKLVKERLMLQEDAVVLAARLGVADDIFHIV